MLLDYLVEGKEDACMHECINLFIYCCCLVVFVLLSIFWPEVYCSHDQLEISINNPSTFCTVSGTTVYCMVGISSLLFPIGIVFQYTALQVGLFAVIQLWFMFYSLYFAEKAKKCMLNNINHLIFTLIGMS